jgi:protein phosphatase
VSGAIEAPADALVLLIGVAGSGKTTFAARHFPGDTLSSDTFRALIAGDPRDQSATDDAFRLLAEALDARLRRRRLTAIDATNVEAWARAKLLDLAWRHRRPVVAIVLDLPLELCLRRNLERADGPRPAAAIRRQHRWLRESLPALATEGFDAIHHLTTPAAVDEARVRIVS